MEGLEIDGTNVMRELEHEKAEELLEAMVETEYKPASS